MDSACHLRDENSEEYSDELSIENIYLHICNEEGREFTGVTTFHGMIRIFTSRTWTSLIFWVVVVSTCLIFFIIFSGYILSSYANINTFMRRYFETYEVHNVSLSICGSPMLANHHIDAFPALNSIHRKGDCLQIEAVTSNGRLSISFRQDIKTLSEMFLLISTQMLDVRQPIYLRNRYHHRIFVEATQVDFSTKHLACSMCQRFLSVEMDSSAINHTFGNACERMQILEWSLREKHCVPAGVVEQHVLPVCNDADIIFNRSFQRKFPCYPPCSSLQWKATMSYSRTLQGLRISVEFSNRKEVYVEVRKMDITDVLSFIGGGTSLFLGCSCVTLMETFIFLLKLVLQSINKETCEGDELESGQSSQGVANASTTEKQVLLSYPSKKLSSGLNDEDRYDMPSTDVQSPPRKSIHFIRFLQWHDDSEKYTREQINHRQKPPSLSELRSSSFFDDLDTHSNECSLKNLPVSQRRTFDGTTDHRRLVRQSAVEVAEELLDQHLSEPAYSRSFCDDFERKHPGKVKIRRISSGTSRGSASSSRANIHIVEHPRRRSQIYNRFMAMNDF